MLNVHFSLLPRWRGAAPVERAILAGDVRTGVCIMALEAGLDTGPVYACREVAIGPDEHAHELADRLARLGADLLVERLAGGVAHLGAPEPQRGEATYAAKLTPAELELDFGAPAAQCARVVRAGRAWTRYEGARLLVLAARPLRADGPLPPPGTLVGDRVATSDGWLELGEVQRAGRVPQPFSAFARGARIAGAVLLGERDGAR